MADGLSVCYSVRSLGTLDVQWACELVVRVSTHCCSNPQTIFLGLRQFRQFWPRGQALGSGTQWSSRVEAWTQAVMASGHTITFSAQKQAKSHLLDRKKSTVFATSFESHCWQHANISIPNHSPQSPIISIYLSTISTPRPSPRRPPLGPSNHGINIRTSIYAVKSRDALRTVVPETR